MSRPSRKFSRSSADRSRRSAAMYPDSVWWIDALQPASELAEAAGRLGAAPRLVAGSVLAAATAGLASVGRRRFSECEANEVSARTT